MDDQTCAEALAASSWDTHARLCAEHSAAAAEYETSSLLAFLFPDIDSEMRAAVAEVALRRAEGRIARATPGSCAQ